MTISLLATFANMNNLWTFETIFGSFVKTIKNVSAGLIIYAMRDFKIYKTPAKQ